MRWRSSRCPSLGCLALDAEQRPKDGVEWTYLSSDDRPPQVRPYPLYNEIGRGHDGLGERVYGLHAPESKRALQ
jgi:hypothetical protein